jgi:hypothetical protein
MRLPPLAGHENFLKADNGDVKMLPDLWETFRVNFSLIKIRNTWSTWGFLSTLPGSKPHSMQDRLLAASDRPGRMSHKNSILRFERLPRQVRRQAPSSASVYNRFSSFSGRTRRGGGGENVKRSQRSRQCFITQREMLAAPLTVTQSEHAAVSSLVKLPRNQTQNGLENNFSGCREGKQLVNFLEWVFRVLCRHEKSIDSDKSARVIDDDASSPGYRLINSDWDGINNAKRPEPELMSFASAWVNDPPERNSLMSRREINNSCRALCLSPKNSLVLNAI